MFKFIHCADLHLGSGFSGLSRFDKDLVSDLAHAPADTFGNIVSLALAEQVNLVVIAGDVFDSPEVSWIERQRFCRELERLNKAEIPVLIAGGNHDPVPQAWPQSMQLPENTRLLPADHSEFYPVSYDGAITIQAGGISHNSSAVPEDISPEIGAGLSGKFDFTIVVLHANVDGSKEVANYAPTTVEALRKLPVNYWALGHVHSYRELESSPHVVYSGVPQGRSVHEPGERGVVLVQVDNSCMVTTRFCKVGSIQFETLEIKDLSGIFTINELLKYTCQCAKKLPVSNLGILRVIWSGPSPLHGELHRQTAQEWGEILAPEILSAQWHLESVIISTRPFNPVNKGAAKEVEMALAEFKATQNMEKIYNELRKLRRGLPEFSTEELDILSQEAAELLSDYLTGEIEI